MGVRDHGVSRAFIAAELPSPLQAALGVVIAGLRAKIGSELVRWVPPQNIHLTFKFLGEVSASDLKLIQNVMVQEAAKHESFEAVVEGFGSYPNGHRPRVLWVGLTAPDALESLQRVLDAATARLGYPSEQRGYSPHLTIGRARQNASAGDLRQLGGELAGQQIGNLGRLRIDGLHLFRSDLRPTGSTHTRIFSAPLATT